MRKFGNIQLSNIIKEVAMELFGEKKREKKEVAFVDSTIAQWSSEQRKIHIDMLSCFNL